MSNLINDEDVSTEGAGETNLRDHIANLLDKFNSSSRAELVEPPQIEGSTVNDWLQFFISNGFIFIVWLLAMIWVSYIVFYHSRVVGYILTKIINYLFIKNGYFKIGSFSLASISGKIMVRDLVYITEDFSLRVQDGWVMFNYWIPYVFRNAKTEDLSICDARVSIFLNGFELHIYNRSQTYSELEKLFNLPPKIFSNNFDENINMDDQKRLADEERRQKFIKTMNESPTLNELKQSIWRDLFPVTKIEIASGRFVFGNHLMPSTMSISFDECHFSYTSRPANSGYDLFTHVLKGKAENLQVVLIPSPKYSSFQQLDEPPRYMGDGFIVFRTNKMDFNYYQDEPGLFVEKKESEELDTSPPAWGINIKCGKGTDFSYGPWADRQRDHLYSFFYPSNYQEIPVSEKPQLGQLRRFETFNLRLSTLFDAKIDILFSKNKETKALHLNAGPGTYLEMSIPWICSEIGYTTHIVGQILHLDATTSLQFRPLISSETLEINLKIHYPRIWNAYQEWNCTVTACKATIDLIFAHKVFIQDLIDDWSDRNRADINRFIPYTWRISFIVKEFELLVLANEHNWIDCSTGVNDENCKIAICGEHFDMAFDLPFFEFLPPKLAIKIWIQGECLEGAFYLPECTINREVIELIQQYSILMSDKNEKKTYLEHFGQSRKWKNVVSRENHWHECMRAPIVALNITYDYFPMPLILPDDIKDSEVTTPEMEEMLLSPLRPENRVFRKTSAHNIDANNFDPTVMEPDTMMVDLEIGPMNLAIFGSLFILLWNIKENYLGESQIFSEMSANFFDGKFETNISKKRSETMNSDRKTEKSFDLDDEQLSEQQYQTGLNTQQKTFDPRQYRPFEVTVLVTLHEIQGHLVQCTNHPNLYSPFIYVEKLCFELVKGFTETTLQLIIFPSVLQVDDRLDRSDPLNESWNQGFLTLSSLQFRGHAMFSNYERPIDSETLEYAWLVEVDVGEISGRLTTHQLKQLIDPLENFVFQILQADIGLQPPNPFKKCVHDQLQNECSQSDVPSNRLCPYSEDLKYRMVRVIVNEIDLFILESNVAINLVIPSLKLATCNLHIVNAIDGFTLLVDDVNLHQYVTNNNNSCGKSINQQWLESGSIITGPIFVDAAISSSSVDNYTLSQIDFIKKHDFSSKRLWFLWNEHHRPKCGCIGNSTFFGCNLIGQNLFSFNYKRSNEKICFGEKFHDHSNLFNPCYGESLFRPGKILLNINSPFIDEDGKSIFNAFSVTNSFQRKFNMKDSSNHDHKIRSYKLASKFTNHNDIRCLKSSTSIETSFPSAPIFKRATGNNERFFSAEDLSFGPMNSKSCNRITESDLEDTSQPMSPLSSDYASPQLMLSNCDDIKSGATQYYSAIGDNLTSKYTSAHTSNSTIPKFFSLSTDSSPTLVSPPINSKLMEESNSENSDRRSSITLSTNSFISALSEHEDLDQVDLRNQLEKPIFESPLLMSTYSIYLSQYCTQNLDIPPPFPLVQSDNIYRYFDMDQSFEKMKFHQLIYHYRHEWRPKFSSAKFGFSQTRIISRNETNNNDDDLKFIPGIVAKKYVIQRARDTNFLNDNEVIFSKRKATVTFSDNTPRSRSETNDHLNKVRSETLIMETNILDSSLVRERESSIENIQVYVEFRHLQLMISPLSLDVTAKFINSLDQMASRLHPGTLLNHLSFTCQNQVQNQNSLKKEKQLYLGQLHMRAWKLLKQRQSMKHLNRSISFSDRSSTKVVNDSTNKTLVSNNLEVDKKVSINVLIDIGRIDLSSIQASVVEEIIPFSALDRVKDFTCVTVLNISLNDLKLDFKRTYRQCNMLHIIMDQSSVSNLSFTEKALMTRFFTRKPKKIYSEIETFVTESTNAFVDERCANLTLATIHLQLSRMVNSDDVLKAATLTVIPISKTKVDFFYSGPDLIVPDRKSKKPIKVPFQSSISQCSDSSSSSTNKKYQLKRQECVQKCDETEGDVLNFPHFNRFIMFEMGLETFTTKLHNSRSCNAIRLKTSDLDETELDNIDEISNRTLCSSNVNGSITKVWFHFSSPPKFTMNNVPQKNEFTCYDWHLLSSAVPVMIAWVSAIDRMAFNCGSFCRNKRQRLMATLACLMSKSLNDSQSSIKPIHSNSKQLTRIFSSMAKTFQEDPSIQMINLLRTNMKKWFQTNSQFEAYLANNQSPIPVNKDLERALIVLLTQWKNLIHSPGRLMNLSRSQHQQQQIHSQTIPNSKSSLSATKNPIMALIEEKTKQLNLSRNDANIRSRLNVGDNDSLICSGPTQPIGESDYLLRKSQLSQEFQTPDSNMVDREYEMDNKFELSSINTRNTASEIPLDVTNKRRRHTNRVQFMSSSRSRVIYDQFLNLPLIRNLSTMCHHMNTGMVNSFNRIMQRTTTNNRTERVENIKIQEFQTLDHDDGVNVDTLVELNIPDSPYSLNGHKSIETEHQQQPEIRLNIENVEHAPGDDPYYPNGRYSSYSNYGDKKDLYWWMVKQQDYMKNVANNLASTIRDYTKQNSSMHYFNLDQDITANTTNQTANISMESSKGLLTNDRNTVRKENQPNEDQQTTIMKESNDKKFDDIESTYFAGGKQPIQMEHPFETLVNILNIKDDTISMSSMAEFDMFGTRIMIHFNVHQICIDIDEAESDIEQNMVTPVKIQLIMSNQHFAHPLDSNLSAFVCDNLVIETVLIKQLISFGVDAIRRQINQIKSGSYIDSSKISIDLINILHEWDKKLQPGDEVYNGKPLPLILVFAIQLGQVTQRINLPLLRMVHQFLAMYENVVQTRFEMRSNRSTYNRNEAKPKDTDSVNSFSTVSSSTKSELSRRNSFVPLVKLLQSEDGVHNHEPTAIDIQTEDISKLMDQTNSASNHSSSSIDQVEKCWQTVNFLLEQDRRERIQLCIQSMTNHGDPTMVHLLNNTGVNSHPIVVIGNGHIKRMNLVAMLSTLNLDGDLSNFAFKLTHHDYDRREKPKQNLAFSSIVHMKKTRTTIVDVQLERTKLSLFEDMISSLASTSKSKNTQRQLVVEMLIGQSSLSLNHTKESNCELSLTLDQLKPQNRSFDPTFKNDSEQFQINNSARVLIGAIDIDIPQHPVALHGMMTRSGKQLSTTIQELRSSRQSSRFSRQQTIVTTISTNDSQFFNSPHQESSANSYSMTSSFNHPPNQTNERPVFSINVPESNTLNNRPIRPPRTKQNKRVNQTTFVRQQSEQPTQMILPFIVDFSILLESFTIKASLLPSLRAQYRIGQVTSSGFTGSKAKFIIDINHHSLCFNTKIEPCQNTDINLPTEASIHLPGIHMKAEYMEENTKGKRSNSIGNVGTNNVRSDSLVDGEIVFCKGSYLNMVAEIGSFEHCLTTDLLNHLLFVQKVFMKEVNEVVQKMSRSEDTLIASTDQSEQLESPHASRIILFSLQLRMTGIQITATTPTNSAVRFETDTIELHLSNRVMNMSKRDLNFKVFVRVQLDFNLALGQLIRNAMFEEAEPDFQQFAYFKARIGARNALQDEVDQENQDDPDKEVVLITLTRPLLYVQPLALDRAVLIWINYKNAYEYWNEQRANLNSEVIQATQQLFDKVSQPFAQTSATSLGTLFLQLNVNDLGVCLPISCSVPSFFNQNRFFDSDLKDALVLTLESTRISACSRGSLVSKGLFKNLCIRFADDFETNLDDWKPNLNDSSIKNLCIVSEGTYEICSRTITHQNYLQQKESLMDQQQDENSVADAKWFLNVSWKMDGFDIHVDTSIGKHISALFKTMTAIAGNQDDDEDEFEDYDKDEHQNEESLCDEPHRKTIDSNTVLNNSVPVSPNLLSRSKQDKDSRIVQESPSTLEKDLKLQECSNKKRRSRNIEKELTEQAKVVSDLQQLGASSQTIQQEIHRYHELETAAYNHFKRDVIKRLKHSGSSHKSKLKNQQMIDGKLAQSRPYSTSLYSYDERDFPTNQSNDNIDNDKIELNRPIRSSTISIPHLKYDENGSLLTLSSYDEASSMATDNDSPLSPYSVQSELTPTFNNQTELKPPSKMGKLNSPKSNVEQTNVAGTGVANEPKIDFELDVKIFFNSGKCVLHTKDQLNVKDGETTIANNRNFSSNDMTTGGSISPTLSANQKTTIIKSRSSNKLTNKLFGYGHNRREYHQSAGLNPDFTVFLIPGLDIKLHYSSKSVNNNLSNEDEKEQAHFRDPNIVPDQKVKPFAPPDAHAKSNSLTRQKVTKKAFLFAWITLSSIPDEIFISPHILDFFEEALKPIPITMSGQTSKNATLSSMESNYDGQNMEAITDTPVQYVYYASFPVDVMVFFHFQPTIIRLGCLPVSRVECLLHLPSIDLVMSSKKTDLDLTINEMNQCSSQPISSKTLKNISKSLSSDSQSSNSCPNGGGGLSITGCLADFSMYIFHPYGGQKNKVANPKQSNLQPSYSTSDRKDSLSLQVEFIKINISRSRKVILADSLTQSLSFSAICDIGTATFKYDVRRLNEILAFPKAWYRKAIWKKIFIGENTVNAIFSDNDDEDEEFAATPLNMNSKSPIHEDVSLDSSTSSCSITNECSGNSSKGRTMSKRSKRIKSHMIAIFNNPWETLVLLTVNFSNLNISMNMGNVMGNAHWLIRNLMCDGSISIDSNGHRKYRLGIGLKSSTLDAKGGIVGGIMELSDIRTEINVREDRDREPQHRISCSLHTIENRVDYMGTSILMARISDLSASFYDEWRINTSTIDETSSLPTNRPASIYIHGSLNWDQMQVLMSKSTSPDFGKIISKLEEFFSQQFHSGKRVFDSLHPANKSASSSGQNMASLVHRDSMRNRSSSSKRTHSISSSNSSSNANVQTINENKIIETLTEEDETSLSSSKTISHHRHWQRALKFVSQLFNNSHSSNGIILGGTIEICAQNISLACFYGVNFRSKSWAVFSLKQPSITFMTEAQMVLSENDEQNRDRFAQLASTHVIQNLSLHLGRHRSNTSDSLGHHRNHYATDNVNRTMATVCKISRNVVFPPQFRHLHEWFHYAFSPIEIDDVSRFPLPSPENAEFDAYGVPIESLTSTPSQMRVNSDRRAKSANEFNYKEEMIFAFPSMQLDLKTEHMQSPEEPTLNDRKPKVLCSFVSDFDDHIYVAVDAEAYFFLHDLINSYINESSRVSTSDSGKNHRTSNETKSSETETKTDSKAVALTEKRKSEEELGNDFRDFICKIWQLEPTVRLHSWASKNIDPYGVDYILQRLGFNQARTTIPKWIQRSTMDGIDKMVSLIVYQMLLKSQEENAAKLQNKE